METIMQSYTVKQLARLAGVTNRTLHYYDQIGLLQPTTVGSNGYRYYGEAALLRLQQILFYRELGFSLEQIKAILEEPGFDLLQALEGHKRALQGRIQRTERLIATVENTIQYLKGETLMSKQDFYSGFDEEKQKEYTRRARERWGDKAMARTKDWNAYTPAQKNDILAEGHEITLGVVANMDKAPDSPEVQFWIERWHQSINKNFYDCSLEIFEALGHGYVQDPEFNAFYENIQPGLAAFMEKAMTCYCQVKKADQ
jgi:DNA-binding transcriptional MerR regulator